MATPRAFTGSEPLGRRAAVPSIGCGHEQTVMLSDTSRVLALVARAVDGRRAARGPGFGLGVKVAAVASSKECPRCGNVGSDFVRGVCRSCYTRVAVIHDSYGRRLCIECHEPGTYAHGFCAKCYMRDYRRRHRMVCTCAICGARFQSPRSDALYCSLPCRLRARRAAQSAKEGS
jgi:hypothetical protein